MEKAVASPSTPVALGITIATQVWWLVAVGDVSCALAGTIALANEAVTATTHTAAWVNERALIMTFKL